MSDLDEENKVNGGQTEDQQTKVRVNAAEVPIPQFWKDLPELWFKQLESLFKVRRINSDEQKFNFAIAQLPMDVIATVAAIIRKPPLVNKYESLRDEIVKRRSLSEQGKIENLLKSTDMGDFSPSDFYRHLEEKAGTSTAVNAQLLKTLWLGRLPDSIRSIVAIREQDDINELINFADRIFEINRPNFVCNAVESSRPLSTPKPKPTQTELTLVSLQKAIDQLTAKFNREFAGQSRSRSRSNNRYRRRSGSRSGSREGTGDWICYYHRRFREKARKCDGCTFGKKNPPQQPLSKEN